MFVGRPIPAALVSTALYLMEIDLSQQEEVSVFRSEWFDEERTIYMDGRGHPDPSERFITGHSAVVIIERAPFAAKKYMAARRSWVLRHGRP
jgi:hypothetical protein